MTRTMLKLMSGCLILVSVVFMTPATVAATDLAPFFGNFIGQSLDTEGVGVSKRDFNVTIEPVGKRGFELSWRTFTYRSDGTVKKKDYSIQFRATDREGIYSSAEKKDMFGAMVPSDPMKGESYLWARITGQRLTVYGFVVTDEGGYEMQVYHRTLTESGMDLEFTRQREDGVFRRITGVLRRVEE